jgi:hypothetical protein
MYTETLTSLLKSDEKVALEALAEEDSASQASVIRREAKRRDLWPQADAGDSSRRQEALNE